ncbi:MAG: 7-cyano-7-deazaguanine synthase QueC [Candidatus Binataceae bacterium]|jgi:7-cyano-7-deazaguanine synthase
MIKCDGVAIVSGGLDSVTMAHYLVKAWERKPHLISFDYGQRHIKELDFAEECADELSLPWSMIDLSSLTHLISSSALTFGQDVPEGHYAEDNMALTVVPNRNMMMLSIAAAIAVSNEYTYIAAGMHAGDHAQYPDCRPQFIGSIQQTLKYANEGFTVRDSGLVIDTPWIAATKSDIARHAFEMEVPLEKTWSCYKGNEKHCGRCGTCVERLEAIASVTIAPEGWDKTEYEDSEYWKTAVTEFQEAK